jgi:lipoprotein-anchoring transpeptidase ErfK/SrfK
MTGFKPPRIILFGFLSLLSAFAFSSCGSSSFFGRDTRNKMIVSVSDQQMLLVRDGQPVKTYKISTSKFGLGDKPGSNRTPLGHLRVAKKVGCTAPQGAVFKSRKPTGEILKPNSPGRDPIVTRILWLKGLEDRNQNAFKRTIYIHGTPEEKRLGQPASFGCIRMSSRDIADLYNRIGYGADVFIIRGSIQNGRRNGQAVASSNRNGSRSRNRG